MNMKMYMLKCPACGGTVEIEPDRKSCFCTYCSEKIHLDDGIRREEITKTIHYHKTYTDEAKIKDIESRERMYDKALAKEEKKEKRKNKETVLAVFGVLLGFALLYTIFHVGFNSEKKESDQEEIMLQITLEEIMQEMDEGDYEAARIKAQSLYYTSNWSSKIEEKWDATREEIIKQIDEAEKEAKKLNPPAEAPREASAGKWWNPFD